MTATRRLGASPYGQEFLPIILSGNGFEKAARRCWICGVYSFRERGLAATMEKTYTPEYQSITVRTTDGSTINGKVNIADMDRVSDLFTKNDTPFIVMVDVMLKDAQGKTRFVNKDHIVWVEPEEY